MYIISKKRNYSPSHASNNKSQEQSTCKLPAGGLWSVTAIYKSECHCQNEQYTHAQEYDSHPYSSAYICDLRVLRIVSDIHSLSYRRTSAGRCIICKCIFYIVHIICIYSRIHIIAITVRMMRYISYLSCGSAIITVLMFSIHCHHYTAYRHGESNDHKYHQYRYSVVFPFLRPL